MALPLTKHGVPEIALFTVVFGGGAVAALMAAPGAVGFAVALVLLLSLAFVFNFFRDPDRVLPGDDATVVAPADGKVTDITTVAKAPFVDGPALRIGIFLSVFDVHVNRTPVPGKVLLVDHRPGAFLDARDPCCADLNESCDLGVEVPAAGGSVRVLVRQIAGLIARRIICTARPGDVLARGERYGMIKFGSRTEVWLPVSAVESVTVMVGQHVKGGRDPIARIGAKAAAPARGAA